MTLPTRSAVRELTVCIHGILSEGGGFTSLIEELRQDPSFDYTRHRVKIYNHGFTTPLDTLSPGGKKKLADAIGGYLHRQEVKYSNLERINVVAHSFGSFGICEYLRSDPYFRIDDLILVGSVVPVDFPWDEVEDSYGNVLNIIGGWDWVPIFGPLAALGTSGDPILHRLGLRKKPGFPETTGRVENYVIHRAGHCWYKTENGVELLRGLLLNRAKWVV